MSDRQNQVPIITELQLDELERLHPGDIVRGYLDGFRGSPWPDSDPSPAYEHGRRNGVNDRAGTSDTEQGLLARDVVTQGRLRAAMKEMGAVTPHRDIGDV